MSDEKGTPWVQLLIDDGDLRAQYEVLLAKHDLSHFQTAIHLARFAEARVYNAADRVIEDLRKRIAKLQEAADGQATSGS